MNKNLERFLNYVKIDTQSDDNSATSPSTSKQFDLANLLLKELQELDVQDLILTKEGVIYGKIPSNIDQKSVCIGFNAHIDTAQDCSGANVKPQVHHNYNGQDIILSKENKLTLSVAEYPILKDKIGHTIITTSGDTLLGADDKAGITIIMGLIDYLHHHRDVNHGDILISFTPDEEIGRGTQNFDITKFKADFAYTLDGSIPSIVEYENFNAASAEVSVHGVSIHPGTAKNKMINAAEVAMEFHNLLPRDMKPQHTEGYEGFNHLTYIEGGCDLTKLYYIIRNHDINLLNQQKATFLAIEEQLNQKYGYQIIETNIQDGYRNMKECFKDNMISVELAYASLKANGFTPSSAPIRGGTDGASITYLGVPCPNLGTGGYNFHGRYEYLDFTELEKMIKVIVDLVQAAVKI